MRRPFRLIFLSLAFFLVLFPLSVGRPGMPVTLKADEPAYLLGALSLVHDGDLRCDAGDVRRLFDRFPYLPTENLIIMSDDGWDTIYFGKPYLYSLLAAPAAAIADYKGLVALNMILLLAMAWMGTVYLSRFNPEWLAGLFALAFFLLSSLFAYVFWLQPEVLNTFSVAACLFFAFHEFGEGPRPSGRVSRMVRSLFNRRTQVAWSGAVLAIAVYHKPMLAALGVPALYAVLRRRGWRAALAWLLAAAVAMGVIVAGSVALTDEYIAYMGSNRIGVKIEDPARFDEMIGSFRAATAWVKQRQGDEVANTFGWLVYLPRIYPRMLAENLGYFLWGRHTGLLVYLPFAAVAFLFFLLGNRRSSEGWVSLAAMAALALYFVLWLHYNWHGGAGFVGNRYFISAYPGFLFLVAAIRPAWLLAPGFAAAGFFVAPIVFTPYGAPVPKATLQAHIRGPVFEKLPVELSIRPQVPGYETVHGHGVEIRGRQDLFRAADRSLPSMWVWGAATTELWIESSSPLDSLFFEVSSPLAADNEVVLKTKGDERRLVFSSGDAPDPRLVELATGGETRLRSQYGKAKHAYRLVVTTRTGRNPRRPDGVVREPQFYLGAEIAFVGSRPELERPEHFEIGWRDGRLPERVEAGARFRVRAFVANRSDVAWRSTGALPVRLAWHWLDANRQPVVFEGLRSPLRETLAPGEETEVSLPVRAPEQPGSYILVLDAVREPIGWFSRFGADTLHLPAEVVAPEAVAR